MNLIAKAALQLFNSRNRRMARQARHSFLVHYSPREAQVLLDELQSAWHLYHGVQDDEKLMYVHGFYKRLSQMLAADYALLKEGRRWLPAEE
jgi:hypothetical protein